MSDDQDGVSGCMFLLVPAYSGSPGQRAIKRLCVCESLFSISYIWNLKMIL